MNFIEQQLHPKYSAVACTQYAPDAVALRPLFDEEALLCAGAYFENAFHLAVVFADTPTEVILHCGEKEDCFTPAWKISCERPPVSLSWLLRPEEPLLCVYDGVEVCFHHLNGVLRAWFPLETKSATAFFHEGKDYIVTSTDVHPLAVDLASVEGKVFPIRARPCKVDNRTDVLWQTGRKNPGTLGGMMFSMGDRVFYACGDTFYRCADENLDTFLCEVYDFASVYSRRYLVLPNGGAACFFAGPEGRIFAAFVGSTPNSIVYKKAALLPMDWAEGQFLRPDSSLRCEGVSSTWLKPVEGLSEIRDSFLYAAPDGCYYLTATSLSGDTHLESTSAIRLWRSKDLKSFEPLGVVYDYKETPSAWQNQVSKGGNSWAPEMICHGGTYWITYSTSPGCGMIKSVTGKPEGPYVDMGRVVNRGIDSGFFREDGRLYLLWQNGMIAPLSDDGTEMLEEPVLLLPSDGLEVGYEGVGLIKVAGKYVLYGAEWNGDFRIDGSYDMMYSVSDHLMGPYSPRRVLVPHGGHSCLFHDHEGSLRYTIFGNDRTAPFRHGLGIGYIDVDETGEILTLSMAQP